MSADQYEQMKQKYCTGEPFVRAKVVAEYLDMNLWTVYKMAERGKIRSHKFGKARRFKLSEVEEDAA